MRTTKTVSISLPPADLKIAERLAKTSNRSLSGVIREGLKRLAADQYWEQVQTFSRPKAEVLGLTEDDVVRIIHEYRHDKRVKTGKKESSDQSRR